MTETVLGSYQVDLGSLATESRIEHGSDGIAGDLTSAHPVLYPDGSMYNVYIDVRPVSASSHTVQKCAAFFVDNSWTRTVVRDFWRRFTGMSDEEGKQKGRVYKLCGLELAAGKPGHHSETDTTLLASLESQGAWQKSTQRLGRGRGLRTFQQTTHFLPAGFTTCRQLRTTSLCLTHPSCMTSRYYCSTAQALPLEVTSLGTIAVKPECQSFHVEVLQSGTHYSVFVDITNPRNRSHTVVYPYQYVGLGRGRRRLCGLQMGPQRPEHQIPHCSEGREACAHNCSPLQLHDFPLCQRL